VEDETKQTCRAVSRKDLRTPGLDNTLGFCTVKLRHIYIDLNRKKHLKSKNTIIISKLFINILSKVHNLPSSFF